MVDEEPVRRWLCLNLYACDRPENLSGLDKWLMRTGLIRYVAEAYVGSALEKAWGIMENDSISVKKWERYLSIFTKVELEFPMIPTLDARIVRKLLKLSRIRPSWRDRLLANLFGGTLSGLCGREEADAGSLNGSDLMESLRCPDCGTTLRWQRFPSEHFVCRVCGPFPQADGVHVLLSANQGAQLYPQLWASRAGLRAPVAAVKEQPQPALSPEERIRAGKSPHDLTGEAIISSIRLIGAAGQPTRTINSGDETAIELMIDCHCDISSPVLGFIVRTEIRGEPTIVYDTNTMWRNMATGDFLAGETIRARFAQKMNLGPGRYTLSAAIASAEGKTFFDWREAVLDFLVLGANDMQGIANLGSEIHIARVSSPTAATAKKSRT